MGVVFFCIRNLSSLAVASVNFLHGQASCEREEGVERVLRNAAPEFLSGGTAAACAFSALLYMVARQIRKCRMELHIRNCAICC